MPVGLAIAFGSAENSPTQYLTFVTAEPVDSCACIIGSHDGNTCEYEAGNTPAADPDVVVVVNDTAETTRGLSAAAAVPVSVGAGTIDAATVAKPEFAATCNWRRADWTASSSTV